MVPSKLATFATAVSLVPNPRVDRHVRDVLVVQERVEHVVAPLAEPIEALAVVSTDTKFMPRRVTD
jgi:hypothetical protein